MLHIFLFACHGRALTGKSPEHTLGKRISLMDLSNYIIAFNEECKQEDNYCKVKNYIENLLALDEKFIMV